MSFAPLHNLNSVFFLPLLSFTAGNISINQSSSDGNTFTSDSTTAQQGKVFFSSLAPGAVVYTVPNSNQAIGPVKQEGLQTSLVFSQVMPLGQNGQLQEGLPSDSLPGAGLPSGASSLVNVTLSPGFSLAPPALLNADELASGVPESPPLPSPVTSGATVVSVSSANYATLQNCSLIAGHDLMSISTTQPALEGVGSTAGHHPELSLVQAQPSFGREQQLPLQSVLHVKENFLPDADSKTASHVMMLDSKTKYVMSNMVDVICEELGTDKKELAKLQTVQLDEDMQDL